MSGDKTKSDKASEIWFRLLLNESFKSDIRMLKNWLKKSGSIIIPEYYFRQDLLLRKYKIIPSNRLRNLFDRYVLKQKIKSLGFHDPIRLQTPSDKELQSSQRAFIKLWIYDGVTRDEIIDYLKREWKKIQSFLKIQEMPKIKRVRMIKNKQLINLILKLNKLTTQELRKRTNEHSKHGVYRETLIARLIPKRFGNPSIESIKMIIARYGNKRNA